MDYEALYQQKLTTAGGAVKVVKSGDWVDYGWCTGTACALDKGARRTDEQKLEGYQPARRQS